MAVPKPLGSSSATEASTGGDYGMTPPRICIYRFAATIAGLVVFFSMSFLYAFGDRSLYENILRWYGIAPFRFPFLDISAWLAVWECARLGVDVIASNPCDVLQRSYSCSPLWIAASAIPLGVRNSTVVGCFLDLAFIWSLSLLPSPRRSSELMLVLAASLSTMVIFALERANPDVMLFLMVLATGILAEGGLFMRVLARAFAEHDDSLRKFLSDNYGHVMRQFTIEFARLLPQLSKEELYWRIDLVTGALTHAMSGFGIIQRKSDVSETTHREQTVAHLIRFAAAGLRAP